MSAQVTRISSSVSANPSNLDLNSLAHEVQDRVSRATNVIFYGVPEIPPGTPNTDIAEIAGIRHALNGIGSLFLPDSVPHRRLPYAASVDGPRRLLIRLGSVDMVRRILANANRLPTGISVTSDRTVMERDTIRSLHRQMVQHNAAHPERPLTINFLNNVPTLVDRVASRDQPTAVTNRRRSSVASVSMAAGVSLAPPVLPPPSSAPGGAF